jgi:steroid 5-alpha reductase family enzyme
MITIESYLLLILVWIAWCGLHSALTCVPVTDHFERVLGTNFRFYRLAYNLISIATLAVPVFLTLSIQRSETVLLAWAGMAETIRFFLIGTAVILFISGGKQYDLSHFLGISQVRTRQPTHLLKGQDVFIVSGVSRMTRHPWYLGGILMVWSAPNSFFPSTVITAVIISVYFLVGTMLEEYKLVKHFGDTYREYQQDVSMLFPLKWLNRLFKINNKRGD